LRCLTDVDPSVRKEAVSAVQCLSEPGDILVTNALCAQLMDTDSEVRQLAADTLVRCSRLCAASASSFVSVMLCCDHPADNQIRRMGQEQVAALIAAVLDDSAGGCGLASEQAPRTAMRKSGFLGGVDAAVRRCSMQLLGAAGEAGELGSATCGLPAAVDKLKERNRDWRYRLSVEAAMKVLAGHLDVNLRSKDKTASPLVSSPAKRSLKALQIIVESVTDKDQRVTREARNALSQLVVWEISVANALASKMQRYTITVADSISTLSSPTRVIQEKATLQDGSLPSSASGLRDEGLVAESSNEASGGDVVEGITRRNRRMRTIGSNHQGFTSMTDDVSIVERLDQRRNTPPARTHLEVMAEQLGCWQDVGATNESTVPNQGAAEVEDVQGIVRGGRGTGARVAGYAQEPRSVARSTRKPPLPAGARVPAGTSARPVWNQGTSAKAQALRPARTVSSADYAAGAPKRFPLVVMAA